MRTICQRANVPARQQTKQNFIMQTTRQLYVLAFATLWLGVGVGLHAQAAFPESAVQIAAAGQGLTPLPSGAALPRWITVWLIQPGFGGAVPMPGLPATPMPLFELPDGSVLADDTINQVLPGDAAKAQAILAAEASAVVNLVTRIQGAETLRETEAMLGITHPDAPSPNSFSYTINSNLLWLQITNVSGGKVYATLNQASNRVYTIFSATNLALPRSQWYNELVILPTNHQCMPFTLPTAGRQDLFLLAEDCTSLYTNAGYLTNGLVAYWKLNDANGSIAVDQVAGNNLILKTTGTSLPTWGPGYLTFDGQTEYADAGNPPAVNIYGPISICAWCNCASFPTGANYDVPVEKGYDGSTKIEAYFMRYSGGSIMEAGSYSFPTAPHNFEVVTDNPNTTGQWYFLTATYDNTNWNIYINGLLYAYQGGDAAFYGALTNSAPLYVGAGSISGNPERFFNGSIHDVGIYNRALSADEVRTNFLNTDLSPNVAIPDLLCYKMTCAEAQQIDQTNIVLGDYSIAGNHMGFGHCGGNPPSVWLWTNNPAGIITNGLHFNGANSTLTATNSASDFNFTNSGFTVNQWILALSPNECFLHNGGLTNGWYIAEDDNRDVIFASASPGATSKIVTVAAGVNASAWAMVTCVWDRTNGAIYINGAPAVVSGSFSPPASSSYSLIFGVDPTGTTNFDGDIWLPQIWSSGLSAHDVANLYLKQLNGISFP